MSPYPPDGDHTPDGTPDVRMHGFTRRDTVAAALAWLDAQLGTLGAETVPLRAAAGRVLATPIVSDVDVPGFDRATMDGYALVAECIEGATPYNRIALKVVGDALPGSPFGGTVARGEAVRIMTGAPMPSGADAVLPAEAVESISHDVFAIAAVSPGKNIGRRGEDIVSGTTVLEAGRGLRPQDLGVMSSIGVANARVVRQPRVRLVITGNEVLPVGSRPRDVHITDANGPMLAALAERDGAIVEFPGPIRDEAEVIRAAMHADADVIIVSGGSSVGVEDLAPMLLARHGELAVHGIAMRPSSPTGMGKLGSRLVFLLPGNPVSALCAYDFFAGRAIRALGGRSKAWPYRSVRAPLARKISSPIGRLDYARVKIESGRVEPLSVSGASVLSSTTRADGFVIVGDDSEGFPAGADVDVWLYLKETLQNQRQMLQEQFLQVLDRDEAERRFRAAVDLAPRGIERVALDAALGRVLGTDVLSPVDVPSFDRSNFDGFAVVAEDTFGASEEVPRRVRLADEVIHTGVVPSTIVRAGEAVAIATGGMMPRGADAVVLVEHTDVVARGYFAEGGRGPDGGRVFRPGEHACEAGPEDPASMLSIARAVTPGHGVSFAGTDITAGETVLRRGTILSSRDTGVLAAIGVTTVDVWQRPIVAILSTGDEIIAPGEPMRPARVYDSNAQVLADAVREFGGEALRLGIVPDDENALRVKIREALASADIVLLSGGTSKGAGDISYRVVSELTDPGIVAHGVALKPGKPICLAASFGKPVVVLPGFPTSAIFTFHEFVAPVLCAMAGRSRHARATVQAKLAVRVNSEIGRTEYLLVGLVPSAEAGSAFDAAQAREDPASISTLSAYPMGQGSGSVTTFSRADGFTTIGRHEEIVPAGTMVTVQLLDRELQLADLVVIGSHCVGLDYLLSQLHERGVRSKFLAVGSNGGLEAARRGECDLAGVHLLDPESGEYNRPFLTPGINLIKGYGRLQGIVFRKGDARFEGRAAADAIAAATRDASCIMVNRNQGSGTRALIDRLLTDRLLAGAKPAGYAVQPRTHNAVAAAVVQKRADWGMTLDTIARGAGLGFIPVQPEQYDFVTPSARAERAGVKAFVALLAEPATRDALIRLGMKP